MGVELEMSIILAYAFGVMLVIFLGWIMLIPLKFLIKLIINVLIGGLVLLVLNFFGGIIGIHIGVNVITALTVGILGVPGVLLLLLIQYIM